MGTKNDPSGFRIPPPDWQSGILTTQLQCLSFPFAQSLFPTIFFQNESNLDHYKFKIYITKELKWEKVTQEVKGCS